MDKVTMYKCSRCGAVFDNVYDCKECEDGHVGVKSIQSSHFKSYEKYPYMIKIKADDGNVLNYTLKVQW